MNADCHRALRALTTLMVVLGLAAASAAPAQAAVPARDLEDAFSHSPTNASKFNGLNTMSGAPGAQPLSSARGAGPGAAGVRAAGRRSSSTDPLIWEDRFDASGFDQAFRAATLKDRVFAVGWASDPTFSRDFLVRAYDQAAGTLEWQDRADFGANDFASGVATDGQRVFASGWGGDVGHEDWVVRAYDPNTGTRLWQDVFDLAGGFDATQQDALLSEHGLLYVGGSATTATGRNVGLVRAYDAATGALRWQDSFHLGGVRPFYEAQARSFSVKDGRLFVSGKAARPGETDEILVRAYDAHTGRLLWEHTTPGGATFGGTFATRNLVAGDQLFVASARETDAGAQETLVEAFDTNTGAIRWRDQVSKGGHFDFPSALAYQGGKLFVSVSGGPMCLTSASPPSNCAAYVRAYSADSGGLQWERTLDYTGFDDLAFDLQADRRSLYLSSVTAWTDFQGGEWRIEALRSTTGTSRWQSVGGSPELPLDLALGEQRRLFAVGRGATATDFNWDFLVRAYDTGGH